MSTIDWTVVEMPEVALIHKQVSREIARKYEGFVELDDVLQEGFILLAQNGARVRRHVLAGDLSNVAHELRMDLTDVFKRPVAKLMSTDSLDLLIDQGLARKVS